LAFGNGGSAADAQHLVAGWWDASRRSARRWPRWRSPAIRASSRRSEMTQLRSVFARQVGPSARRNVAFGPRPAAALERGAALAAAKQQGLVTLPDRRRVPSARSRTSMSTSQNNRRACESRTDLHAICSSSSEASSGPFHPFVEPGRVVPACRDGTIGSFWQTSLTHTLEKYCARQTFVRRIVTCCASSPSVVQRNIHNFRTYGPTRHDDGWRSPCIR
jgi:hypothetical protein